MKRNNGITLVALVITIIVLLILAGVTITLVIGDNGLLSKTKYAGEEYIKASIKEEIELALVDISAELATKSPPENISKEAVINKLPDKMQEEIIIGNDLTGEYKGYEYWIDKDYVVHIGDKVESSFKVSIKIDKIGTTYFTVSTSATSNQGAIIGYSYLIDGVEKPQTTDAIYTVSNLEEKTEHTAQVKVVDEKGNVKESRVITITTEPREYLYKDGEEFGNLFKTKNENSASVTLIKEETQMGYNSTGGAVNNYRGIYKEVDLTNKNYIKLCMEISYINTGTNTYFGFGSLLSNAGGDYMRVDSEAKNITAAGKYEIDITNYKGNSNFIIQSIGNNTANLRFTRIWLEK